MTVERLRFTAGSLQADSLEDPTMVVHNIHMTDEATRWVKLPESLGGQQASVLDRYELACPVVTEHGVHPAIALDAHLDDGRQVCVVECGDQFLWFARG